MKREILPLAAFVALVGALVLATGCGFSGDTLFAPVCTSDEQCNAGEVCFSDGCGDPGAGIRVEVTPNVQQAYYAQDFEVPELKPVQNLQVAPPSAIAGLVQREVLPLSGPDVSASPYSYPVTLTATGESALIPGVRRRFSATVSPDAAGAYRLPISSGQFTVGVSTLDTAIPPTGAVMQSVSPGEEAMEVNFVLPSSSSVLRLDGRLVRTGTLAVQSAEMEVQAYDPLNQRPLSQRVPASSGQTGSTGDFNVFLSPDYRDYEYFNIVATPKDATAMVPMKRFRVAADSTLKTALELGDYGLPIEATGIVHGADGQPISGATVYVEGPVNGGGEFKSQRVVTGVNGEYTLRTLGTELNEEMTLWVIPPAKNAHGILRQSVFISSTVKDLGTQVCAPKPVLTGSVLLADGQPGAGIRVVTEPIAEAGGILPPSGAETVTDASGAFSIALDPAEYRIDLIPTTGALPRKSVVMIVSAAGPNTLDGIQMSRARTVTGVVSSRPDRLNAELVKAVPYATVRYFRVSTPPGQKPSSVLLAESVADGKGNYTVTLPTR